MKRILDERDRVELITKIEANKQVSDDGLKNLRTTVQTSDNAIISKINDHTSNTNNPHGITKSQIGLGNVENVTTNDQTPKYTEATTLTKLSSGEKLSIAFGKISKAITDFITHKADKENPHNVTAHQAGAYTQEEINTKIDDLIDSAPDSLNTLNELATAIGDHIGNKSNPHNITISQLGTIEKSNLSASVQASLELADTSVQAIELVLRVSDGYIQYSTNRETWNDLMPVTELSGFGLRTDDDGVVYFG